jgi:hypothetical protein
MIWQVPVIVFYFIFVVHNFYIMVFYSVSRLDKSVLNLFLIHWIFMCDVTKYSLVFYECPKLIFNLLWIFMCGVTKYALVFIYVY